MHSTWLHVMSPQVTGDHWISPLSLILWPSDPFVCFLSPDKAFTRGFIPVLGCVTEQPSISSRGQALFLVRSCPPYPTHVARELVGVYLCVCSHMCVAQAKVDDMCPVIVDRNVFCVSKQSTVTGQQVPQSVTHFLPPSLFLSLSRNWAACLLRGEVRLTPSSKESLHPCPRCPSICGKALLISWRLSVWMSLL